MAGRPILLDDEERREKVLGALRIGSSLRRAAQAGGLSEDTLGRYLAKAEEEDADETVCGFCGAVREARAEGYLENLKKANAIAGDQENPAAAVKSLEMLFRMSGDLAGPGGPSVAVEMDADGTVRKVTATSTEIREMNEDDLVAELTRMES